MNHREFYDRQQVVFFFKQHNGHNARTFYPYEPFKN